MCRMSTEETKRRLKFDRKKMMKNILKDHTAGGLDDLYEYFQELERKFQGDKKRISVRYDEESEKIKSDPELEAQLAEYFSEEFHMIENTFLKTFRYSMVVAIYSLVEVSLNDLCRYLCNSNKMALTINDLRDDGIQRAKLYLTKVCMVDFPASSHEWDEIIKLNFIRNCIIHTQGNVGNVKSPGKIINIVDNTPSISIKDERYLMIERSYVEVSIHNAKKLLENVYDKAFEAV